MAQRPPAFDHTKLQDLIPSTGRDNEKRIKERIHKLKEIEDLGSEVVAVTADVSDEKQMQSVISTVRDRFGDLHGVIHTAGTLGQGLIHSKTRDEIERVLAPKVKGICVLESLLRDTRLDFLILCSSLSSIFPIIGQIDYCAANAFLDAFARYKSHHNESFTVSIDWGFWQELGMIENATLAPEAKRGILEEIRNKGLANAGVEVFRYVLSSCRSSQIIVSPQDLRGGAEHGRSSGESPSIKASKPDVRPPGSEPETARSSISQILTVTHPLFDECIAEGSARKSYITHLSARRHWVVDEHRLAGTSILPGTAYLEMARAAVEHGAGDGLIELREVYFLTPLVLEDDQEKEVRTIVTRQEDYYEFFIASRMRRGQDQWQEHARGEITLSSSEPATKHDIKTIESIFSGWQTLQEEVTEFGPRWHNLKRMSFATDQGLAMLELPDDLVAETGRYKLHPALLDMATGFMCIKDQFHHGLPFSYKSVRVKGPLPAKVYSYIRHSKNHHPATPKYDVTIMDEEGTELVDVEEYALRNAGAGTAVRKHSAGPLEKTSCLPEDFNFCLEISSPGTLDTLKFRPLPRKKPDPGEVEIEVCVTGLNFIEVLFALGLLPNPPGFRAKFGLECAGRIAALGAGVKDFAVGDEVIAFSQASFALFTTSPAWSIAHKPSQLSLEEAATIPAAYVTAYHALVNLGRLRQGERVLIHAAAGGVGMAAVNIAQHAGAEIFATAGSEEKRAFLRSLGITNVMDSRSLAFADEVMARTGGEGVDVVLNSLGGEFISRSLSILAPYGRFLELGKRDIHKNTQLGLGLFEKHLSFFAIDVGTDLPDFGSVWRDVLQHFNSGHFKPLPYRVFPITDVVEAFKYMAQARHIGKIVVSIENKEALRKLVASEQSMGVSLLSIIGSHPELDTLEGASQSRRVDEVLSSSRGEITHQRPGLRVSYSAPRNETEQTIAAIWQELLGIAQIGIHDDFFELRGDSLLAAQVVSRLNRAFQIKLPLSSLFDAPTVASLGQRIEKIRWSAQELQTLPRTAASGQEEEGEV
jgi:NADPH:quinone reductase-like Zn-dependent oxidoreductase/acyl carrier protein